MPSFQSYLIRYALYYRKWKNRNRQFTLNQHRRNLDKIGQQTPLAAGTKVERVSANAIPCEWVSPSKPSENRLIFYLHGGAYQRGSLDSHRGLISHIAEACQAKALSVDYRLAPEQPFPAAVDDAFNAYHWLQHNHSEAEIIIAGDSAGAGLAMACMLKIKEEGIPLPKAALLLAPWVDLTGASDSLDRLARKDPFLSKAGLLDCARQYYGKNDPKNPYISPVYADLSGFPPLLIQAGTLDILLDEGKKLAENAQKAGVTVELEVWENMIHVWQILVNRLPEARQAIQKMGEFVDKHTS